MVVFYLHGCICSNPRTATGLDAASWSATMLQVGLGTLEGRLTRQLEASSTHQPACLYATKLPPTIPSPRPSAKQLAI